MSQSGVATRPLSFTSALAAALALSGAAAEAVAQQITPLMSTTAPNDARLGPAARYATPDGQIRFVFDRSSGGRAALLRFDGDSEVHVLRPFAAAGGGELYRNEANDIQLRVTPHGGVTIYVRGARAGRAAAEEARVDALAPQAFAAAQYQARMRQLQTAAARALGRPIVFEAPAQATGAGAGLVLDAAERAAAGIAATPGAGVQRVIIRVGPAPSARMQGEALHVQIAPAMGYAGRPSTTAIRAVLTGRPAGPER